MQHAGITVIMVSHAQLPLHRNHALTCHTYWAIHFTTVPLRLTEIFLQSMDSKTWEGSRCRHHVDFSKWVKKRPAILPLARPKTRSFCTFRNLSFDRSTTEDKPLYLTSFTGKKIVPKPRQRTLSAPSQRLENSISRFDRRPTCPAATTGCYGPPLCIRPISSLLLFGPIQIKSLFPVAKPPNLTRSVGFFFFFFFFFFFWFCRTWTKRYLITSQTRVKRVSRIHHRTILSRWCIRLTRLTLVCEVIRYRLVQVRQNQKKTFRVGGPQSPFSISSSFILSFVLLPFFINTKMDYFLFWIFFDPSRPLIQVKTQDMHAPKHHCMQHITKSQTQHCQHAARGAILTQNY